MDESTEIVRNIDKNLMDSFWKLTENNVNTRIDTSVSIVRILRKKQNEAVDGDKKCRDLEYTVARLVKGLASSRDVARLGYALVLTEILSQLTVVEVEDILEHIKNHLYVSNKQDKRDVVFGQLFAYSALVRSGRLQGHSQLSNVLTSLYHLSLGRGYILKACYEIFVSIFSQIAEENFQESVWPHLKKDLNCGWENCSTDVMWMLFLCLHNFPNSVSNKFLKKNWDNEDIFAKENLEHLKRLLKQTTSVLPMVHPLCSEFLALIVERKDFREIWSIVIDENLFELDKKEKAFVGFEMIKEVLQKTQKKKVIKCVLSARFCTAFTKSFLNQKHPMNPAANQLAEFLCGFVKNSEVPDIQILVLKAFLQPPGTVLLNQVLRKKEVSIIISHLLPDAVKGFCEMLKAVVLAKSGNSDGDDDSDETVDSKRLQAATQIGILVSHPVIILDTEWRLDVVKFLFLHSFFIVKEAISDISHCEKVHDPLPASLRVTCVSSFTKALDSLYRKAEGPTAPLEQLLQLLLSIAQYADQLMAATESISPVFPFEKVQGPWQQMKHYVNKLSKQCKKDGKTSESNAFQVLFLQLGLQLFIEVEQISDVLEELHICCKKALKVRKHIDGESEEEDGEPPWIGVVVDIVLSLLSKSSHHMRKIVASVFPFFCPFITQDALQQILDVVNPEKNSEKSILVDESDEGGDSDQDVEFESGSSSDEDDGPNVVVDEDDEFKQKIKNALGSNADVSDAESETVLTDSEMFKLDDALSEAFRSRKITGHTQLSTEDKNLFHFRVRCLDLIKTYLKSEPPMKMVLLCIQPVMAVFELGAHKKLQTDIYHKAVSLLQIITKIKKFQHCNGIDAANFENILDALIAKCHTEKNPAVAKKLYTLCVFVVLCCRKFETQSGHSEKQKENGKCPTYLKKYVSSLEAFVVQSNSHMLPQFFVLLMSACPDVAWHFLEPLTSHAFKSSNRIYKRTQCLGLILEILKFSKGQKNLTPEQWLEFGKSVIPACVEALKTVIDNSEIKPLYTTELLDVICTSHKLVKEKTGEFLLEKHRDLLDTLNTLTESQVKLLTRKGNALKRKVVLCLGGSVYVKEKPQIKQKKMTKIEKEKKKMDAKGKGAKRKLESESDRPQIKKMNINGVQDDEADLSA